MPDVFTKAKRSEVMSRIRSRGNKARDLLVSRTLRKAGWRVVRIWEHELQKTHAHRALRKLRATRLIG